MRLATPAGPGRAGATDRAGPAWPTPSSSTFPRRRSSMTMLYCGGPDDDHILESVGARATLTTGGNRSREISGTAPPTRRRTRSNCIAGSARRRRLTSPKSAGRLAGKPCSATWSRSRDHGSRTPVLKQAWSRGALVSITYCSRPFRAGGPARQSISNRCEREFARLPLCRKMEDLSHRQSVPKPDPACSRPVASFSFDGL